MSRFSPLFSSSKGNSTYLSGGGSALLVDAGVSLRRLTAALAEHGVQPGELDGVLITHEHTDHIRGLPILLKKHPMPLYATRGTLDCLQAKGCIPAGVPVHALTGQTEIAGIRVFPFATPHDASQSVGFRFVMPDQRTVAIATDLGHITEDVRTHLAGCDLVMLESNYDAGMLDCSAYPYPLKRRIKSDHGHLSNEVCAEECIRLIRSGTTRLILGHLSENNNLPAIAYQTTKSTLDAAQLQENRDYLLGVAPAKGPGELIVF